MLYLLPAEVLSYLLVFVGRRYHAVLRAVSAHMRSAADAQWGLEVPLGLSAGRVRAPTALAGVSLSVLRWATENGLPMHAKGVCEEAASLEDLSLLVSASELGFPVTDRAVARLAHTGHPGVAEWLREDDRYARNGVAEALGSRRDTALLQRLYRLVRFGRDAPGSSPFDPSTPLAISLFEFLGRVARSAAAADTTPVLQWVYTAGPAAWDTRTLLEIAASNGNENTFTWLCGLPITRHYAAYAMKRAMLSKHEGIARVFWKSAIGGEPITVDWRPGDFETAVARSNISFLGPFADAGDGLTRGMIEDAVPRGNKDVLEWAIGAGISVSTLAVRLYASMRGDADAHEWACLRDGQSGNETGAHIRARKDLRAAVSAADPNRVREAALAALNTGGSGMRNRDAIIGWALQELDIPDCPCRLCLSDTAHRVDVARCGVAEVLSTLEPNAE